MKQQQPVRVSLGDALLTAFARKEEAKREALRLARVAHRGRAEDGRFASKREAMKMANKLAKKAGLVVAAA